MFQGSEVEKRTQPRENPSAEIGTVHPLESREKQSAEREPDHPLPGDLAWEG